LPKPARAEHWSSPPAGYTLAGNWTNGNGQTLSIPLDKLENDSLVVVQAEKLHQAGGKTIPSSLQLKQAAILLVGPDPAIPLKLRIPAEETAAKPSIQVFNGRPGVFYHFHLTATGKELSLPAYFHKWAPDQGQTKRGIEKLRLNVDFAVTNTESPQTPIVDFNKLPDHATLHIQARKAFTNVTAKLNHPVEVPAKSLIKPLSDTVELNSTIEIHILESRTDVDYQLLIGGEKIGEAEQGNGAILALPTPGITEDTTFTLRSGHHLPGNILFEIDQHIEIKIKTE